MKSIVSLAGSVALACAASWALAQSTTDPAQDAAKATKPTGQEAMESQMQLQKNKPSKTMTDADKAKAKHRPGGAAGMQSQMDLQKNKPSKPVDKTVKVAPRPDASKMTPEERAAYRKDVVKESKP